MIEVRHIFKSYGKQDVLKDISFALQKGEVTAFLGANGAGKTTTMNIMCGILAPDRGNVLIEGKDIFENPLATKQKIGYLPEDNPLYMDMYVDEYLEYVALLYNFSKKKIRQVVDEAIESVELTKEYKKKIGALSQGNKQRVGLAQVLVHDPEVLILDEPTTGLDPSQQFKINTLIRNIGRSKAILFSSHRIDDVEGVASRYLLIKDGVLLLEEPIEKLDSIKEHFYTTVL